MVFARARSRLACCTREGFLATPIESWNRRLNSSSVSSLTFCSSSSPFISRQLAAFIYVLGGATAAPPPDPPTGRCRRYIGSGSCPPRWNHALKGPGTGDELGLDADLLRGEPEPFARRRLVHAFHLVHDASRLDHGDPELRVALALAHPRLRRLLRHRLVGENTDEDLPPALHAAGEGDTGRLDLAIGHPSR